MLICNQSWVRVIPPKLRAIPPKLRAVPPKSADIFFDFIEANIQQSIPPKLVSNDGIPPKAVFKSEIWKFWRNPKPAKTSIHLELSGIDSRRDCQEKRVRFQCWWRGQRAKTSKTGDPQVRPDNEPRNYVAWLTATPSCTRYLIWDLCASCRNGDIADIFYRPHQHLLLEVRSCGSCLGQLWGGEKSREPLSILPVDGFSIRSNSFTEKLKGTKHTHTHTQTRKLFTSFAQTYVRASYPVRTI